MKNLSVVKFGGSVLTDWKSIRKVAELVKREVDGGKRLVIVVSALKNMTDSLIELAEKASFKEVSKRDMDLVMSSGEELAAKLLYSTLKTMNVKIELITPSSKLWPIITDNVFGNANPLIKKCKLKIRNEFKPLLEKGYNIVICGFLGKTEKGEITTMGRGGSDLTAVVLASCLGLKEVVLVKDVEGFYTADPAKVKNAKLLNKINVEEASYLTLSGAKVIANKALKYILKGMKIRIVGISNGSLTNGGTVIEGDALSFSLTSYNKPVCMVTVVGKAASKPETLKVLTEKVQLSKGKILAISTEEKAVIFYVDGNPSEILNKLHEVIDNRGRENAVKAISTIENLALVTLKGKKLETTPGVIARAVSPLAEAKINVFGLLTIHSSIRLFVPWSRRREALNLLRRKFGER